MASEILVNGHLTVLLGPVTRPYIRASMGEGACLFTGGYEIKIEKRGSGPDIPSRHAYNDLPSFH